MSRPKRKARDVSEIKAKKARGETDLGFDLKWMGVGDYDSHGNQPLLTLSSINEKGRHKIAGFDIDSTIIQTKSGRKFATGSNDWEWLYEDIPSKLRQLDNDGYRVTFFTNQAGIEKQKTNPRVIMDKIEAILKELNIPVFVFISTGTNHYRKPSIRMWEYFENHCNQGVKVDRTQSLYIGDAAGRAKNWAQGKPRDFSCSDRMFAINLGVEFQTPEEYFEDQPAAPFVWGSVNPMELLENITEKERNAYAANKQEMIIMVGHPASGKSSFSKRYLVSKGYVRVNRDTLGTPDKCLKMAKTTLDDGDSVVIDNTNPAAHTRADYIKLAKKKGVPCRCFVYLTSLEVAKHLNFLRMIATDGAVRRVPDVAYNVYKKNFEQPKLSEGFTEIVEVPFVPHFSDESEKKLFCQWTAAGH